MLSTVGTQNKNVSCFSVSVSKTGCPSHYLYFLWLWFVAPARPFVLVRSSLLTACGRCSTIWYVVLPPTLKASVVLGPLPQKPLRDPPIESDSLEMFGKIGVGESAVLMCSRRIKVWDNCFNLFLCLPSLPGEVFSDPSPENCFDTQSAPYLCLVLSVWVKVTLGSAGSALSHWTGELPGLDVWPLPIPPVTLAPPECRLS